MKRSTSALLFLSSMIIFSCKTDNHNENEKQMAENTAIDVAEKIYTLRFHEAKNNCTEESMHELRFMASNISEKEIELYNTSNKPIEIELDNFKWLSDTSDSIAEVNLIVRNAISLDSINQYGIIKDKKNINFLLRKRNGQWKVDLTK